MTTNGPTRIPILMYHSISAEASPAFMKYTVAPDVFESHLAYLSRHQYTGLTVTQLVKLLRTMPPVELPARPVVITFDDGFEDFYTAALPALRRYGLPATLYVITGLVGGTSQWLAQADESGRKMVSWSQLAEIRDSGIEIGGHSQNHPQLDLLPAPQAWQEIASCKAILEEKLGQEISSFAYPHGYHTLRDKLLVQEAGYTSACAVRYALSSTADDTFALARRLVPNWACAEALEGILTAPDRPGVASAKRLLAPLWRLRRRVAAG